MNKISINVSYQNEIGQTCRQCLKEQAFQMDQFQNLALSVLQEGYYNPLLRK